ncbi:hypothetical protein [Zavarzinia sp. CC-PAN008]|uniref:hypothetical protein n=1 Tax=Zavarzinia sp. CC-PAN008 TaxID=3243332 RepID=UPI003F743C0F
MSATTGNTKSAARQREEDRAVTHQSVMVYGGFRYLKWAVVLVVGSIVAYALDNPVDVPNGGTWLGYTLGTIGALIIFWLTWFGVRKRQYAPGRWRLEAWLSAHIYLGLSLIVVATLHTGFQFGWNLHTLAYALMMVVIFSGAFGIFAYLHYPRLMTENRRGQTLKSMLTAVAEIDAEARDIAIRMSDDVNEAVQKSAEQTKLGGSFWNQLTARNKDQAAEAALETVRQSVARDASVDIAQETKLLTLLSRKVELLRRARRDIQIKAILDVWLYIHVPITFALLAALVSHILAVFFYW